ncbi:MAG: formate dehydrogenase ferredoxin subunit [Clostridiales bacterium]|jgi:NADH-quinone oxidoreductase subunit E|nr:formate dehydrogenase ferredoxin subunit [Clostridiales bacterium]
MTKSYLSEENFATLHKAIDAYKDTQGPLMPVLHEAQHIFGAIPIEVQKVISERLNVPLAEIYGVVTFYSQFTLEPTGEFLISVCLGTACYVRGSQQIIEKVTELIGVDVGKTSTDGKFSLQATRCIGACGLAPVMTVNDDVYGRLTVAEVPGIVKKYQETH